MKPLTNGASAALPVKLAAHSSSSSSNNTPAIEVAGTASSEGAMEVGGAVFIKTEPGTPDCLPSSLCYGDGRDRAEADPDKFVSNKSDPEGVKRRLSLPLKGEQSKWNSLSTPEHDTRDDLKLTAYDVIAGVISTPPIKPLEPEGESATSKLKVLAGQTASTPTLTTITSSNIQHPATPDPVSLLPATTPPTSNSSRLPKEQRYLVHELDEFSKILNEVTQEQTAMELASVETVYSEHSREPHLASPYVSGPPPGHREVATTNTSFYQKNSQLQGTPSSSSQVVEQDYQPHQQPYHCHQQQQHLQQQQQQQQQQQHSSSVSMECKSRVPGRLRVLSDPPTTSSSSSSSSQPMPHTPTAPLEHFTSFPAPSNTPLAAPATALPGTSLPELPGVPHLPAHPGTSHPPPGIHHHQSPHPGTTHHPSIPVSQQQGACPSNTSTPPLPYRYHCTPETNGYQNAGGSASVGDGWPLSTHMPQQQPQGVEGQGRPQLSTVSTSQGSLKDSFLARVSSRVASIVGQKRPRMLDLSGMSPGKMKRVSRNTLDSSGGSSVEGGRPLYSSITHGSPYDTSTPHHMPYETTSTPHHMPYETTSTPHHMTYNTTPTPHHAPYDNTPTPLSMASVMFPHQHL